MGKPLADVEVRLGTPGKRQEAPGPEAPGPVWIRSPNTARMFVPALDVALRPGDFPIGRGDEEGWFRTGNLAYLDQSGRLILKGREDNVVKIDGKRVALGEVAGCLESFAKVREAEARMELDIKAAQWS